MTTLPLRLFLLGALSLTTMIAVAAAAPVAKGSGAAMCVLTQRDFKLNGLSVAAKPSVNLDNNGASAYCVYSGKSGATGGIELDVFYPAGSNADEVTNTWKATLGSDPAAQYKPEYVPSADESVYALKIPQPGHSAFAANAVRRGDLIFTISLPDTPDTKKQLSKLSQLVLARL